MILLVAVGFVALAVTVVFGFEEANGLMLLVAALLLFAPPAIVVARIAFARNLTREAKRARLRALTGRRALDAWATALNGLPGVRRRTPVPRPRA